MHEQTQIVLKAFPEVITLKDDYYFMTPPVRYHHMTLRVTRGSDFTPMEKLMMPFDSETWKYLIATFVIMFLIIFIFKLMSVFIRGAHISIQMSNSVMILAEIFFGIGLVQTPVRHSGRIFFTVFTIFCLIMRTAYQGKMFDFLQSNETQPDAHSIQDVIDKRITVKFKLNLLGGITEDFVKKNM